MDEIHEDFEQDIIDKEMNWSWEGLGLLVLEVAVGESLPKCLQGAFVLIA